MDTIFPLPLTVLAAIEVVLALLIMLPKPISLPISQLIIKARRTTAARSVFYTNLILLSVMLASGVMEVLRGMRKGDMNDTRPDHLATVDMLRAQVFCVLCVLDIALLLMIPAHAEASRQLDSQNKNLEAMKRQVKGLQTEYERVTAAPAGGDLAGKGGAKSEADDWKHKVDKLIREKGEQQAEVDAAIKGKAGAEAKVEAMMAQIKGFDKEYDRVLEENKLLQRRLAQVDPAGSGASYREVNKKDD